METCLGARRSFLFRSVSLAFGLCVLGFAEGCDSRINQPSSPATVDRKMPKGWEQTKATMQERMKKMRKQGGPRPGANRP
jgi:hypothetical protein